MPLDDLVLERIRGGSRDLWREVRHRLGARALVLVPLSFGWAYGLLWLCRDTRHVGTYLPTILAAGTFILPFTALLAACAMALVDSFRMLIVSGPLLRSLGDLVLSAPAQPGANPSSQFAAFASPQHLARAARVRDLPLILFLTRLIVRVDASALLRVAGMGREGLVREMERQVRDRAAAILRRLTGLVWIGLGCVLALPLVIGWALR